MDETGVSADAAFMFRKATTRRLRLCGPADASGLVSPGIGAPPAPLLPGVWQKCGTDLTIAQSFWKSSRLVK